MLIDSNDSLLLFFDNFIALKLSNELFYKSGASSLIPGISKIPILNSASFASSSNNMIELFVVVEFIVKLFAKGLTISNLTVLLFDNDDDNVVSLSGEDRFY